MGEPDSAGRLEAPPTPSTATRWGTCDKHWGQEWEQACQGGHREGMLCSPPPLSPPAPVSSGEAKHFMTIFLAWPLEAPLFLFCTPRPAALLWAFWGDPTPPGGASKAPQPLRARRPLRAVLPGRGSGVPTCTKGGARTAMVPTLPSLRASAILPGSPQPPPRPVRHCPPVPTPVSGSSLGSTRQTFWSRPPGHSWLQDLSMTHGHCLLTLPVCKMDPSPQGKSRCEVPMSSSGEVT